MRIFIGKLSVFFLLIALFSFFPSDSLAIENMPNGQIVLTSSGTPAEQSPVNQQSKDSIDLDRWYIYEIIFGTHMSIIGLALIALSLLRWKANDLSLISFGMLCFLYGARTRAFEFFFSIPLPNWSYIHWFITYLVPIFAWLFTEQFLGKGWKSSIRRLLQVQIVFSIIVISVGVYLQKPYTAWAANNIMVIIGIVVVLANMFQPELIWNRELKVLRFGFFIFAATALIQNTGPLLKKGYEGSILEALGFVIFLGCLGYVVAHRFFQNEKELITISNELETARQIQSFILPGEGVVIENLQVAARYVPMASVAGDFYDFAKVDEKSLGILVADVSGHGVPASLISSMVKIAFASNTTHAANPAEVLDGINKVLCGKLESDFVTAGYLFLDIEEKNMIYAGAGHMPLLLWRTAEKKIYEFRGKGTVLGQFEDIQFKNIHIPLQPDDRIILYTDGIVETSNATQTLFGFDRLKNFIVSHAQFSVDQFIDALIQQVFKWSGKPSEEALDDDLTLIVVDYKHA
jgi:sigma-B regulation protein RsbU (phosphoserine phosphatase)